MGIQEKFSWKAVAMAAIGGGVGAGFGYGGPAANVFKAMVRGAASSAVTQGIGVVTGLQDKFDWAAVAAAGVGAGVAFKVSNSAFAGGITSSLARDLVVSGASALGNAATRSLINGSDFGDNVIAALPDVIGGAIGRGIGNHMLASGFCGALPQAGFGNGVAAAQSGDTSVTGALQHAAGEAAAQLEVVVVIAVSKAKSLWGKVRDGALFGAGVGWGTLKGAWNGLESIVDFGVRDLGGSLLYAVTRSERFKQSWVDTKNAGRVAGTLAGRIVSNPREFGRTVIANHSAARAASNAQSTPFARGESNPDWQLGINVVTTLAGGAGVVKALATGPKVAINAERAASVGDAVVVNEARIVEGAFAAERGAGSGLPKFTFRGDSRLESEIFRDGFAPRGNSTDLLAHAFDNTRPPSAFVSTSRSFDIASGFGDNIYVLRPTNGINVNRTLGPASPFPLEQEIAIFGKVSQSDIRAVTQPSQGVSILNPGYKPR
jgi:hypothetical protein